MVVATRCTSLLYGFGWKLRIDNVIGGYFFGLISVEFRGSVSVDVDRIKGFLSIGSNIVRLSAHMGNTGLSLCMTQ